MSATFARAETEGAPPSNPPASTACSRPLPSELPEESRSDFRNPQLGPRPPLFPPRQIRAIEVDSQPARATHVDDPVRRP